MHIPLEGLTLISLVHPERKRREEGIGLFAGKESKIIQEKKLQPPLVCSFSLRVDVY
jgi:hypothetical protein